jgi:hypothetical protein
MVTRVLALLTLLAAAALMGDVAQVLCFGEDGHAAFERLVSDEHFRTVTVMHETLVATQHASPGVHVDVSVADTGVKGGIFTGAVPPPNATHAARMAGDTPAFVSAVLGVEGPTLCALRTTVLRT